MECVLIVTGAASDTDIEITTSYEKFKNATTYVGLLSNIVDLDVLFKRWLVHDQLIGKPLEADKGVAETLASNLVTAFGEAKSIDNEDEAKEMLTNIFVYFLGEFAQNSKLKEIAPKIESAENVSQMKELIDSFLLEMTTPGEYLSQTAPFTNINGDTSGVDSTDFTLFPVLQAVGKGHVGYVNADPNSIDGTRQKAPYVSEIRELLFPNISVTNGDAVYWCLLKQKM